jgi:hypothetical protein
LSTISKIPENSVNIFSSSAVRSVPAPLPGCGSSVKTDRFRVVNGGHVKSPFVIIAGVGGIAVIVGAGELTPKGKSVVVAERGREGEN